MTATVTAAAAAAAADVLLRKLVSHVGSLALRCLRVAQQTHVRCIWLRKQLLHSSFQGADMYRELQRRYSRTGSYIGHPCAMHLAVQAAARVWTCTCNTAGAAP
jgi:hypothetical protein